MPVRHRAQSKAKVVASRLRDPDIGNHLRESAERIAATRAALRRADDRIRRSAAALQHSRKLLDQVGD